MRPRPTLACSLRLLLLCMLASQARAQQLIGYVLTKDATVSGGGDVVNGHAVLAGSVTITAKDHTAPITLSRGGTVQLCQSTAVHITESRATDIAAPLLFSLDRGAIQLQLTATENDAIMTPDLRFSARTAGPLDLRVRVAPNGDTCAENLGVGAPTLAVSDQFGQSSYELLPNQHVLFEHGSLREVVDRETLPCGCPDPGVSIADALLASGENGTPIPKSAAEQHPFPAAVSEGLAPTPAPPQSAPGETHVQVTENLHYNGSPDTGTAPVTQPAAVPQLPPPPAKPHGFFHSIGHFFSKLFGG